MIDLGVVKPGSTIRIPFSTFKGSDGSSLTMTNFSTADLLCYKDGNTTERASTSGFTATTDFDSKTGKQLAVIDLSNNTTAGFWTAGSEYLIAIDAVTVDAVTTGTWIARFVIGYPGATLDTTIATLSSQTSFTLTNGPAEDDALKDQWAVIHDIASAVQCARVLISAYTGATKTVTLAAGATFTVAAGDNISIMGPAPMQPATTGRKPVVDTNGLIDANAVKVGPSGSGTAQTAKDLGAINVTNLNTLSSHDPGATIGTSTLTQTQVTGGAYALSDASFAFNSGLDFTTTQKAATLARVTLVDTTTVNSDMRGTNNAALASAWTAPLATALGTLASHDPGATIGTSTYAGADTAGTTTLLTRVTGAVPSAADIKTAIEADGSKLDHLWEMTEDDAGTRRLTTNALEQAPTGGAAPTADEIADEVETRALILHSDYDAAKTAASQASVDDLPTTAELSAALASADDATLAAIAALPTPLDAAGVRTAIGLASANLDTQLADLPTNAELSASLASADDATLAAIAALTIPTAGAIADEVRSELAVELARIDAEISSRSTYAGADTAGTGTLLTRITGAVPTTADLAAVDDKIDAIQSVTDQFAFTIPGQVDANALTGGGGGGATAEEIADEVETRALTLTSAYDAAKTAASQSSVDDVPTVAELLAALASADDATLAALAALVIPTAAAIADAVQARELILDTAYDAAKTAATQVSVDAIADTVNAFPDAETIADAVQARPLELSVTEFGAGALNQLSALRPIHAHGAVVNNGAIRGLVIGTDYLTADGRQLQFANLAGSWPDLDGATITLTLFSSIGDADPVEIEGVVIEPSGDNQRVDVDISAEVSGTLSERHNLFRLDATLESGSVVRLEDGTAEVGA